MVYYQLCVYLLLYNRNGNIFYFFFYKIYYFHLQYYNYILFFFVLGMIYFGRSSLWTALLLWLWFENNVTGADDNNGVHEEKNTPHSRQKRLLWITTDGRLALPPGTRLTITPSLSLPFVRYPPDGFLSNMSISLPFTSQCDNFYTSIYILFIYLYFISHPHEFS